MQLYNKYFFTLFSLGVIIIILAFINHNIRKSDIHNLLTSESEKQRSGVYMDGDIAFQNTTALYAVQMKKITRCEWNQMGVLFSRNNQWFVYEASDIVKYVKLSEWIDMGNEGKYTVKRLKNAEKILNDTVLNRMGIFADDFLNRDYDIFLLSNDEKLYNSELVYKMFLRCAGIKLGTMRPLRDYVNDNLVTSPDVLKLIRAKYGDDISKDSLIISPDEIFNSDKLTTVFTSE